MRILMLSQMYPRRDAPTFATFIHRQARELAVAGAEVTSDRSRLGATSASVATSHRWELVFAEEQLIRSPASGTLMRPAPPRLSEQKWNEVVRVASGRMLGRTPRRAGFFLQERFRARSPSTRLADRSHGETQRSLESRLAA